MGDKLIKLIKSLGQNLSEKKYVLFFRNNRIKKKIIFNLYFDEIRNFTQKKIRLLYLLWKIRLAPLT